MLAGLTNKTFRFPDVEDAYLNSGRRRNCNILYKCKTDFSDFPEANEPINLTSKTNEGSPRTEGSMLTSPSVSMSDLQTGIAPHLQGTDFKINTDIISQVNSRQSTFGMPFLPRRFPFFPPFDYLTSSNKLDPILEQGSRISHLYPELAQLSKSLHLNSSQSFSRNAFALKETSSVLQYFNSCLEQIPLPPPDSDYYEILSSLYSAAIFQAINFQRCVLRYLSEFYEKIRHKRVEHRASWPMHFNDKYAQTNSTTFTRGKPLDFKNLESALLSSDTDNNSAIDLRVRPSKSPSNRCPDSFEQPHKSCDSSQQETRMDFLDTNRYTEIFQNAFNRRVPSLPTYSSVFPPTYPTRHSFSRHTIRSPPRYLNGRRPKTPSFKIRKLKGLNGFSSNGSILGRDNRLNGTLHSKKTSFRGTSEEENEVSPTFKPIEKDVSSILSIILITSMLFPLKEETILLYFQQPRKIIALNFLVF